MERSFKTYSKAVALIACLLVSASAAFAFNQLDNGGTRTMATVRGRVIVADGSRPDDLFVEVGDRGHSLERASVAHDGTFAFHNISRDSHVLRVLNFRGDVLFTQFLDSGSYVTELELRLPGLPRARPLSGRVSVQELKPLPQKIRKEVRQAQRATEAGNYWKAADRLERAALACPACMLVHNNLGAVYFRSGNADRLRSSVELWNSTRTSRWRRTTWPWGS